MKKVSLYVDEKVWASFKEEVFRKYGSLRRLSSEVEALLRDFAIEDALMSTFAKAGIKASGFISSDDVKHGRPALVGPPSEKIVRGARDRRCRGSISTAAR